VDVVGEASEMNKQEYKSQEIRALMKADPQGVDGPGSVNQVSCNEEEVLAVNVVKVHIHVENCERILDVERYQSPV
jgi:hypothetical protein